MAHALSIQHARCVQYISTCALFRQKHVKNGALSPALYHIYVYPLARALNFAVKPRTRWFSAPLQAIRQARRRADYGGAPHRHPAVCYC
jgi:hypothetical protein